jgi:hypothetical protein
MILFGVSIADPAKRNIHLNKQENDHYNVTRKLPGKPQGKFISEQDKLNNFDRLMPSVSLGFTEKQNTIPVTKVKNNSMIELTNIRRKNLRANVEQPILEVDKKISGSKVDVHEELDPSWVNKTYGVNFGNHYNPSHVYPGCVFKQDVRINMCYVRPVSSYLSDPDEYVEKAHYLYNKKFGSYQKNYYVENPWRDSKTGRVHLFERPFTRTFA